MTYPQHLEHAPITEAVIDIRVELPAAIDFEALQQGASQALGYTAKGPILENTFTLAFGPEGGQVSTEATTREKLGLRLHSDDEKYVALVRLQGFSLSRLPPYEDWNLLKAEAQRLWSVYVRQFTPVKITRVATRYINNLRLPMSHGQDFGDFLNAFAQVPPDLPQAVSGFTERFVLQDPGTKHYATVAVVWGGAVESDGRVPVVLDIDAYTAVEHDANADAVWGTLESLRALKNRCFFGSLTTAAWELYK